MTTNWRDSSEAEFAQSVRFPPSNWKVTGTNLDKNDLGGGEVYKGWGI